MPTIVKERVFQTKIGSSFKQKKQIKNLEEFTQEFLHEWLFTAGYGISKQVETAADIQKGVIIDPNEGGLRLTITHIDRRAGFIQFEMDPTSNIVGGPVLTSYFGEIQITEVEEDEQDGNFQVVWKLDYRVNFLLNLLSCGVIHFSTKDMFWTLITKNLDRIEQAFM